MYPKGEDWNNRAGQCREPEDENYILKVRIGNNRAGQCREPEDENYILKVRIGIRELVSVESWRMRIIS